MTKNGSAPLFKRDKRGPLAKMLGKIKSVGEERDIVSEQEISCLSAPLFWD